MGLFVSELNDIHLDRDLELEDEDELDEDELDELEELLGDRSSFLFFTTLLLLFLFLSIVILVGWWRTTRWYRSSSSFIPDQFRTLFFPILIRVYQWPSFPQYLHSSPGFGSRLFFGFPAIYTLSFLPSNSAPYFSLTAFSASFASLKSWVWWENTINA